MPDPLGDILGPPVGATEDAAAWRKAHPIEAAQLDQWNQYQKEQDGITLTDEKAAMAMAYMEPLGITFQQALNLYSQFVGGKVKIPPPAVAGAPWSSAEIDRLRAIVGAAPTAQAGAAPGPQTAMGLPAGAEQTAVGQAILAVTGDPQVQAAMWAGASHEGGTTGPWETTPGGQQVGAAGEVGPWQIHPIHFTNIAPEAAADPNAAALYMLPRYQDAVKSAPADLWQSDPASATMLAVANAERPQGWHEGLTAQEAVAIYGGTATVGAAAGAPGGGGYVPSTSTRVLTPEEQNEAAVLGEIYGLPLDIYKAAKDAGCGSADECVAYWRQVQGAKTLADYQALIPTIPGAEGWTDADLQAAITAGLTEDDLRQAAAAGQKPKQWFDAQMKDMEDFLKSQGLTTQDLDVMVRNEMDIPGYKTMTELGMTVNQYKAAEQTFGKDPDAIWTAKQLGYDPAKTTPGQKAMIDLKTDPVLQMTTLWNEIPEAIKPGLDKLNPTMMNNEYLAAKAQARAQGTYLAPNDFLKSQYSGLFGGGTRYELQRDLERLGVSTEVPTQPGLAGLKIAPGRIGLFYRMGAALGPYGHLVRPTMSTNTGAPGSAYGVYGAYAAGMQAMGVTAVDTRYNVQDMIDYYKSIGLMEYPAAAEMVATRSMAEAMLRAPGPVGGQTPAEAEARQQAVGANYPSLAGRIGANEFETPEQKRLRVMGRGLAAAGTEFASGYAGGFSSETPEQRKKRLKKVKTTPPPPPPPIMSGGVPGKPPSPTGGVGGGIVKGGGYVG
jgi:hypothetical protein